MGTSWLVFIIVPLILVPTAAMSAELCNGALADIGATLQYRDDKAVIGYSDMLFTYKVGARGCSWESTNLTKDKIFGKGYLVGHTDLSADTDGLQCMCYQNTITISQATGSGSCSFKIGFNKNRYPESFEGSCIVNDKKQRILDYVPMTTSDESIWSLVKLDQPIEFHGLPNGKK